MTDLNRTALPSRTDGTVEKTDTLVVGAGQAGVAMSEHLSRLGVPHLVLERNRIAEAWRSGRWDSLVANGPAWHDRFPGMEFDIDPDGFPGKDQVAAYFEAYAKKFDAPIRTGVEVRKVVRNVGRPGFTVETSAGTIEANRVVAATGPFQRPVIPPIAPRDSVSGRSTRPTTTTRSSCPKVRYWWSAPVRRGYRSLTSCNVPGARSTSRWALMTVRRVPTATATSAGGWACSANGMRKSPSPGASM